MCFFIVEYSMSYLFIVQKCFYYYFINSYGVTYKQNFQVLPDLSFAKDTGVQI